MGPVPDTNTDREMNESTTSVKVGTPLERGREKCRYCKTAKENLRIGGGAGRRVP